MDAKVVEQEVKEANEEKHYDLVKIMRVWREEKKLRYASASLKFKVVCEPFPKFIEYVETIVLTLKK